MRTAREIASSLVALAALATVSGASAHAPHGGHGASGVVGLDVFTQGAVVDLLVAEKKAGAVELRHQRSRDGGHTWSESREVATGPAGIATPRRGNDPQVAASGERLVVVWSAPGTSRFGGGPLATALSDDGGRTWRAGPNPADDGSTAEGCPEVGGALAIVERKGNHELHALAWTGEESNAGVHHLRSADGGRRWSRPARLGGPGAHHVYLAASGARLAAVWDEATGEGRGIVTSLSDDGARWSAPDRLSGEAGNASHPLIAATGPGRFLVVWTEAGPGGVTVWRSRVMEPRKPGAS